MEMPGFEDTGLINGVIADQLFRNSKGKVVDAPKPEGLVADTHCHLDMLSNPGLALARCAVNNVAFLGTVVESSENPSLTYDMLAQWTGDAFGWMDNWGVSELLPTIRIIAGCHPHNAISFNKDVAEVTRRCLDHPLTVALGEIGLDYHYDMSPRDVQRDVFKRQIEMAHEAKKPIALHIREAHEDAIDILTAAGIPRQGALVHCYTSDYDTLKQYLDLGCHVAYGGALTFSNGEDIRDSAARAPLSRIVTETDSPYMSPVPLRGTACSPEYVVFVAEKLAEVRHVPEEKRESFFDTIYGNALRFYGVNLEPIES